ncbi:hypothetical protein IY145_10825 [Methylosinus sp. H3A]|uniref:hypothetical protein n=1 Tax=Methylosinus sp. H3A TaxID=2785786 RepID=UPI0018C2C14B|nr:hypothetical protein [Methylosinus sp. H3A]MBG0809872.1 hypothetical protein [Methylosinus sp. H3A]
MKRIVEIDVAELAIRLCEANYGLVRPTPDAGEALAAMEPECSSAWLRSAEAAANYFAELAARAPTEN